MATFEQNDVGDVSLKKKQLNNYLIDSWLIYSTRITQSPAGTSKRH
jgi:hypothetical protein